MCKLGFVCSYSLSYLSVAFVLFSATVIASEWKQSNQFTGKLSPAQSSSEDPKANGNDEQTWFSHFCVCIDGTQMQDPTHPQDELYCSWFFREIKLQTVYQF